MILKILILLSILIQICSSVNAQFSREVIITDSSKIEIIRNSEYLVYEETYNDKDLIWRNVRFAKDSTQLNEEGWKTKDKKNLGVWKEFNIDGVLMYTFDYDKGTCVVNDSLYPYHDLLEKMKSKGDDIIISTYSKEFFDNHVRFNFNFSAYDEDGYVGSWTEPLENKPTKFLIKYDVKLNSSDWYPDMIKFNLDSLGSLIVRNELWGNSGLEIVNTESKTFQIDKETALRSSVEMGLSYTDSSKISEFLFWEDTNLMDSLPGGFKYYFTEFTEEIKDLNENGRSRIVYKYNVYSFNPWTGEFIEKKKMKQVKEWEKNSGSTSGLISDE